MPTESERKRNVFKEIVFILHKDDDVFDKVEHQLLRCYDIMAKDVTKFTKLSGATQYQICHTAALIGLGCGFRTMREIEVLTRNKPVNKIEVKYSLEWDFKNPSLVNIDRTPQIIKK